MPLRIAIVDDDRVLLDSLGAIIDSNEAFRCTGKFQCVEEALAPLRGGGADVLLLDIQLPGMPGDLAIGLLKQACPSMQILMLTVFSDREKLFKCLCNGANGYLLKSTAPSRLLEAIADARNGGSPFSPEIARHLVAHFQRTRPPATSVTPQEQRLLSLLAEGYSYASAGDRMNVSVNTVRNYIRSIYEKLHVHSKSSAVSKAIRDGLIG